jgi:hypothetical protein
MRGHFSHAERVANEGTEDSRRVAVFFLANDLAVIESEKYHQAGYANGPPNRAFHFRGGAGAVNGSESSSDVG